MDSLKSRDQRDSGRKTAPLKLADDAQVVDTTGLSIDQVVEVILSRTVQFRPDRAGQQGQ